MSPIAKLFWVHAPSSLGVKVFELRSEDKKLLTVVFNESGHSVKLETIGNRRTFKLEKEGILKPKTSIINEYGVKIGQFVADLMHPKDGRLSLNDEQYAVTHYRGTLNRLKVQEVHTRVNLFQCTIFENANQSEIQFTEPITVEKFSTTILTLSWILLLPNLTLTVKQFEKV